MIFPTLAVVLVLASSVKAHCQLAWPYPLHSTLNPATPEAIKDYSMTSPLVTSGTYPCKGYINNPSSDMFSVDTYPAGSIMNYTIVGTATHNGGSCQISMSYDFGASWSVIFSQIGGCLVDGMTTKITIPSDAPSGDALFSWSWFNLNGNREMYQNCAVVTITNGGSGLTDKTKYPNPFVANAGVNECVTIENISVVFPNPGKNIVYGGPYASSKPTTPAGFTGDNCVGPEASSSSGSGLASSSSGSNSTSSANTASTSASSASSTTSSSLAASASTSSASKESSTAAASASSGSSSNSVYSLSLAPSSTVLSPISSASSFSAASSTSTGKKTCKARKRSMHSHARSANSRGHLGHGHQRFVRRPREQSVNERSTGGRVAASPAKHASE